MVTNKDLPINHFFLILLSANACILITAYYLQWSLGLTPCPLCILERGCAFIMLLVGALGYTFRPRGSVLWFFIILLWVDMLSAVGLTLRHVWLQHLRLPIDSVPSCLPSLEYLIDTLPFLEVLKQLLVEGKECAIVDGRWMGLSLAEGALIFFVCTTFLLGYFTVQALKKRG